MLAFHLGLDSGGPDNAVFSLQEKRKRGPDNRNEPAVVIGIASLGAYCCRAMCTNLKRKRKAGREGG